MTETLPRTLASFILSLSSFIGMYRYFQRYHDYCALGLQSIKQITPRMCAINRASHRKKREANET